ncbi:unnamed protein product [Protopolystoma xenopodis]|uniref:Tetraspanin n=1 Tax=Protopolystoma xenopodis TaxID=117903 RepID=A0A448WA75_9PLAT|nr:unnamed protein product [Protopolystoma xenopodis]
MHAPVCTDSTLTFWYSLLQGLVGIVLIALACYTKFAQPNYLMPWPPQTWLPEDLFQLSDRLSVETFKPYSDRIITLFFIIGAICLFITFLTILGTGFNSPNLLRLDVLTVHLLAGVLITGAVNLATDKRLIHAHLQTELRHLLADGYSFDWARQAAWNSSHWRTEAEAAVDSFTRLVDAVQWSYGCCGVMNGSDFFGLSGNITLQELGLQPVRAPSSCCRGESITSCRLQHTEWNSNFHTGCYGSRMREVVNKRFEWLILAMVFCTMLTFVMCVNLMYQFCRERENRKAMQTIA